MRRWSALRSSGTSASGQQGEGRRRAARTELPRHRRAGHAKDFQRALDALRVRGLQARRALGIDARELGVQRRPPATAGIGVDCGAHLRIGGRQLREPVAQRLEVQHGAAHQHGDAPACGDLGDETHGIRAEPCRGVRLGRVEEVDEVMRHGAPLVGARLGGADVHSAVHLCRVDAHDLDGQARRDLHREERLAAGRRTHQQDGGRPHRLARRRLSGRAGRACRDRRARAGTRSAGRGCTGRRARSPPCDAAARSSRGR